MDRPTDALATLQEAPEYYLTDLLDDGNLCAVPATIVTLMSRDIKLVKRIHEESM